MSAESPRGVRSEHDDGWRASWFDLRAFFSAWRALRREPRLALDGGPSLGFTPMAFARFGLILLPAALLALAGGVFNLLGRPPDAAMTDLVERIELMRQRLQLVEAESTAEREVQGLVAAVDEYRRKTVVPRLNFSGPQADPGIWDEAEQKVSKAFQQGLTSLTESDRPAFRQQIDQQWAHEKRSMQWMARWSASGANDAFGAILNGLTLIACSRAFRWWVRRKRQVYPAAERAADYFLYFVTVYILLGWAAAVLGIIVIQAGSGFSIVGAGEIGLGLLALSTLMQLWGFYAAGRPIAQLLVDGGEFSKRERRGIGVRLLVMWLMQQVIAGCAIALMVVLVRHLA